MGPGMGWVGTWNLSLMGRFGVDFSGLSHTNAYSGKGPGGIRP